MPESKVSNVKIERFKGQYSLVVGGSRYFNFWVRGRGSQREVVVRLEDGFWKIIPDRENRSRIEGARIIFRV